MRSAGDDGVVDSQSHPDAGADRSRAQAGEDGTSSFDPGIETGYLRRARDHELDPALGAAPFDPGGAAGYDFRRARREAKRRLRAERTRPKRLVADVEPPAAARGSAAPALDPEPVAEPEPAPRPELVPDPEPVPPDPERRQVAELPALRPRRRSLAERLAREREERRRQERQRRTRTELERAERERAARERRERRRRERKQRLRRDREALGRTRPERAPHRPRAMPSGLTPGGPRSKRAPDPTAPVQPRVVPAGRTRIPSPTPVFRPVPVSGAGLVWPTAKAGFSVTIMLALAAALGSVLGLPVPALNKATGDSALVSSATLFGVGPGTPPGLEGGYAFPVGGSKPVDYGEQAAKFGADRYGHTHEGQDVFAKPGTPLFAVRDGVVIDGGGGKSFYAFGGGHAIAIYSPTDDRSYVYLHMRKPTHLRNGDRVQAGQRVGEVGCTGSCDGPHLHFEIRQGRVAYVRKGKPIDPLPYLRQWERFGATG